MRAIPHNCMHLRRDTSASRGRGMALGLVLDLGVVERAVVPVDVGWGGGRATWHKHKVAVRLGLGGRLRVGLVQQVLDAEQNLRKMHANWCSRGCTCLMVMLGRQSLSASSSDRHTVPDG